MILTTEQFERLLSDFRYALNEWQKSEVGRYIYSPPEEDNVVHNSRIAMIAEIRSRWSLHE